MKYTLKLFIITLSLISFASTATDSFNVYLVRHAEKQKNSDDPSLTRCGAFRASQLSDIFSNVELSTVYSTRYQRTMDTASPTALAKKLGIKQYAPGGLEQLARVIKQNKQNVLVVGHSNTTPELASLLIDEKVAKMDDSEYRHLFQIQFHGDKATLVRLTQPLTCKH